MIIINSGTYVISEFRNEFGDIPPCLLPLGNKKLLEYQVLNLRKVFDEEILVSIPEGYELTIDEIRLFKSLRVKVSYTDPKISLADAVLFNINAHCYHLPKNEPLRLLHGDTLLGSIPANADCLAIASTTDDYNWESEDSGNSQNLVWCGYFSFSDMSQFVRALAISKGDFVSAVRTYSKFNILNTTRILDWYDLGHINTYFSSRTHITTQRIFNSLRIHDGIVWKSGHEHSKIIAEKLWFEKLPTPLRKYTPQLIESGFDFKSQAPYYVLEYLPCAPLNEIFVHGRNPVYFWDKIVSKLSQFLEKARLVGANEINDTIESEISSEFEKLVVNKTFMRLSEYADCRDFDLDANVLYNGVSIGSTREVAQACIDLTLKTPKIPCVLHGDFCFSNILYDSRANCIKVIDPRGINDDGQPTIWGDQRYDLAKLCHSVIGLYDYIIAGRFILNTDQYGHYFLEFNLDERVAKIQKLFVKKEILPGLEVVDIVPLTILLFISMLPLHNDRPDRQLAMLTNAYRLYHNYIL